MVAISQSGTTTDTNRAVDMVRERGAHTLAIVNRRDSDITFKVDGVMYTSSGRDIEMSVASTKAFYSQIVAGALLGLYIAGLKNRRGADFVTAEIRTAAGPARPHAQGSRPCASGSGPRPNGWPAPKPTGRWWAAVPTRPRPTRSASS
ncbi:MAG: SIS domain-containing protein [Deltaproteobacteria bacterium]|nr:SIS domain-containing protein [Deltaproteobacteria bacterium]